MKNKTKIRTKPPKPKEGLRPREEHELLDKITYEEGMYYPAKPDCH